MPPLIAPTLQRLLALGYILLALFALTAGPAAAVTSSGGFALPSATTLAAGVGILIPLLVSLVTKERAPTWVKSLTNLVLVAAASAITVWNTGTQHTWRAYAAAFVAALVTSATSYVSVHKPLGITDSIASVTAHFGIGREVTSVLTSLGVYSPPPVVTAAAPIAAGSNVILTPTTVAPVVTPQPAVPVEQAMGATTDPTAPPAP